jgi:presenilin-like A22 family membrane protease
MKDNSFLKKNLLFNNELWKVFLMEAFLFSLTLFLGIITAIKINNILKVEEIIVPQISLLRFVLSFLLATFFILFLTRFLKFKKAKGIIFKIIFSLAIFLSGTLLLSVWISDFLAPILMIFLIAWWFKKPSVFIQDLLIVLAIGGTGGILGLSLSPSIIVSLLIIFSVYDFIAVYKTKHMVKMAKEMIDSGAILGLVVPPSISAFKGTIKEVRPGGQFLVLGGGDIVFPLLFCSSLIHSGLLSVLIVALFSLIGLLASFLFFVKQKKRKPIPALPPIALFSIIGYLITLLL